MTKYKILLLSIILLFFIGCARNFIVGTEPKMCPVHNIALTKIVVPLGYGLPAIPGDKYFKAKEKLFPHSHLQANGGCVIGLKEMIFPKRAKVIACEICNQAEKEWLKNNDKYGD